jgi:hypothetical protein
VTRPLWPAPTMMTSNDSGTVFYNTLTKTGLLCRLVCMRVSELIELPARHWMEDGSVELALGVQSFLAGAVFLFGQTLAADSLVRQVYSFVAPALWFVVIIGAQWGIRYLKERVIAPRAGYIVLQQSGGMLRSPHDWMLRFPRAPIVPLAVTTVILCFTLSIPRIAGSLSGSGWIMGFSCALLFALLSAWSARYYKSPRYFLLALWMLCCAAWMCGRSGDAIGQLMIPLMWMGLGMAVMGAWRLNGFLRANPRAAQGGESA